MGNIGSLQASVMSDLEGVIMTHEKDVDDMPIWQNHEHRITTLEVNMHGLSKQMDSVEETIKDGNKKQEEKLDMINNRMVDEFFKKKTINLNNGWKLLFTLIGGGSFLYLIIEKIFLGG